MIGYTAVCQWNHTKNAKKSAGQYLSLVLTVLTTYLSLARTHGTPTKQKTTTTITIKSELEHFAYRKTDTLADF